MLLLATAALSCAPQQPWNVLLVTFDTTRADYLAPYGRGGIKTPTIDRLAAEGVLFEKAYSTIPLTLPSHSSILTGRYPIAHGVRDNGLFVLPPEQVTMAEVLRDHGYATGAAIGGFPLDRKFGTDQGFDFYDDHLVRQYEDVQGRRQKPKTRIFFDERKAARVNEAVYGWLDSVHDDPFFLWVHYYDPHQPHEPPHPYDQLYAGDLYSGEIAYSDESLGTLIRHLEELGVYDRTLVVFTSDHGEGLDEHNEATHAFLLYETTQHVPLIVRAPQQDQPRRVEHRVGSVDILPSVLELLDIEPPAEVQGSSFAALMRGAEPQQQRIHYAETLSPRFSNDWGEMRALYDEQWKYIHGPRPELYDLSVDADELNNLSTAQPDRTASMRSRLQGFLDARSAPSAGAAAELDEETKRRLTALGYLQGGGAKPTVTEVLVDGGIAPQDRIRDVNILSAIRNHFYEGRPLQAREGALALLRNDPENRFILEMLARAEIELGSLDQALAAIDRIEALGGGSSTVANMLLQLGRHLFFRENKRVEGLQRIDQSLASRPSAAGYHLRSTMMVATGQLDAAIADLENAVQQDANYAPAAVDLAIRRAQFGAKDQAEAEFVRLLDQQPYYAKAHYNYGTLLVESDRIAEAEIRFERAIELDPSYRQAYYALIVLRLDAGDRSAAVALFDALSAKAPSSPEVQRAARLLEESP